MFFSFHMGFDSVSSTNPLLGIKNKTNTKREIILLRMPGRPGTFNGNRVNPSFLHLEINEVLIDLWCFQNNGEIIE